MPEQLEFAVCRARGVCVSRNARFAAVRVFPGRPPAAPGANGFKLSRHWHQPEDDLGQGREPGGLAVLAGLVAASGPLGRAFVAASGAARDEVPVPGDPGGQVGGELVKEARGKSIRSR